MWLAARRFALLASVAAGASAIALAPSAAASPDNASESATAVIDGLQAKGFAVEITGVPSGDASLLTNCTVTAIHYPATPAMTANVDVACPIQRG